MSPQNIVRAPRQPVAAWPVLSGVNLQPRRPTRAAIEANSSEFGPSSASRYCFARAAIFAAFHRYWTCARSSAPPASGMASASSGYAWLFRLPPRPARANPFGLRNLAQRPDAAQPARPWKLRAHSHDSHGLGFHLPIAMPYRLPKHSSGHMFQRRLPRADNPSCATDSI
jgi:hypothetical protein